MNALRANLLIGCLAIALSGSPMTSLNTMAVSKYTVYFYSSETNINNFGSLKVEFDTYLSGLGAYQFQPFCDRKTFELFIADREDGIFLLSSWHYSSLKDTLPMEPVLVGVSKGRSMQKRVLSAKKEIPNVDLLEGGTVASAGSEDYTKSILMRMFGSGQREFVESLQILTVPKDIDALMAVGFDMAEAALTTESSLAKLAGLNPVQYGMLRPLATSDEILLPVVAAPKRPDGNIRAFLKIIEEMGSKPEGGRKLMMLGLDGWKRLGTVEKRMLER